MRPAGIVIEPPSFNDPACHRQAMEDVLVEALVTEAPVEAFDKRVLDRLSGRDVVPFAAALLLPVHEGVRSELSAVVADDHQRLLAGRDDGIELTRHPSARDGRVDDQRQALAGEVIDYDEHPEAAPVGQHVRHEVEAPALVGLLRHGHWRSCAQCPFAATATANRQSLFPVDPEQLFVVQPDALALQQDVQAPIAEPPPFGSKATQALAKLTVIAARSDIAVSLWRNAD